MGLEAATYISQLNTSNPASGDQTSQGDDHLRLVKSALQNTLPNADKAFYFPDALAKTANYTILAADMQKLITGDATAGTFDLTLPALAASDDGWAIWVVKIDSSANAVRLVGTINGVANLSIVSQYHLVKVIWSGSAWYALTLPLSALNITGATALTAPAVDDEMPIYDLSATANRKMTLANMLKVIAALTAETSPAIDDELLLYDLSATTADKITLANMLKVINGLTADASPDLDNDAVVTYDASASGVKKVAIDNLSKGMRLLGTFTASGASELDITGVFSSTYSSYLILLTGIQPGTDDVQLHMRVGTGAGPAYNSGANYNTSQFSYASENAADVDPNSVTAATSFLLSDNDANDKLGNGSDQNFCGRLHVHDPSVAGRNTIFEMDFAYTDGSKIHQIRGAAYWNNNGNGAVTALRLFMSSGTISGTAKVYGYK